MQRLSGWFFVMLMSGALTLGGCTDAQPDVEPGKSTLMDLVKRVGKPSMVWSEGDGSLLVEFAHADEGSSNYMARVAPSGVLLSFQDVLAGSHFMTLKPGMTREQVRRHLGQPASVERIGDDEVWHWPLRSLRMVDWQLDAHFGAMGKLSSIVRTRMERAPRVGERRITVQASPAEL